MRSQTGCWELLNVSQKVIGTERRKFEIKSRVAAKRNQTRENNSSWKGNGAGKSAFHRRLYSAYGKPRKCGKCGTTDPLKSYDYANLTGRYEDMDDYLPMCRSCHWRYDKKILNIKKMCGRLNNARG